MQTRIAQTGKYARKGKVNADMGRTERARHWYDAEKGAADPHHVIMVSMEAVVARARNSRRTGSESWPATTWRPHGEGWELNNGKQQDSFWVKVGGA